MPSATLSAPPGVAGNAAAGQKQFLWYDCDPGNDDAVAIVMATAAEQFNKDVKESDGRDADADGSGSASRPHRQFPELLGISTVSGNVDIENVTLNAEKMLLLAGETAIPVYEGAGRPLTRATRYSAEIHGKTGLAHAAVTPGVTPRNGARWHSYDAESSGLLGSDEMVSMATSRRRDLFGVEGGADAEPAAVHAMWKTIMATPRRSCWLVATGPLTNIALLLGGYGEKVCVPAVEPDDCDPENHRATTLVDHIAGVVWMGGAVGKGNQNSALEFNASADPEAAKIVLETWGPILARGSKFERMRRKQEREQGGKGKVSTPAVLEEQGRLVMVPLDCTHLTTGLPQFTSAAFHADGGKTAEKLRSVYVDSLLKLAKMDSYLSDGCIELLVGAGIRCGHAMPGAFALASPESSTSSSETQTESPGEKRRKLDERSPSEAASGAQAALSHEAQGLLTRKLLLELKQKAADDGATGDSSAQKTRLQSLIRPYSLHDPCAIAYTWDRSLFRGAQYRVDVETSGRLCAGQTVVDTFGRMTDAGEQLGEDDGLEKDVRGDEVKNVFVCVSLDVAGFWKLVCDAIETRAGLFEKLAPPGN